MLTVEQIQNLIDARFGGVVKAGRHYCDSEACLHEVESVALGISWTDDPYKTRSWDRRPLNDIQVSDKLRTEYAPRLIVVYQGSMDWPAERQQKVAERLVILTLQRLVAELPGLPSEVREQCRSVTGGKSAAQAAEMVLATAAENEAEAALAARASVRVVYAILPVAMATAAEEVAWVAVWVAKTTRAAKVRERIFRIACELWLEAAV